MELFIFIAIIGANLIEHWQKCKVFKQVCTGKEITACPISYRIQARIDYDNIKGITSKEDIESFIKKATYIDCAREVDNLDDHLEYCNNMFQIRLALLYKYYGEKLFGMK